MYIFSSPILFTQSFVRFHAAKSLCSFVDSLPNFQFPSYFSIPYSFPVFDTLTHSHTGVSQVFSQVFYGCFTGVSQVFRRCSTGVSQVFRRCFTGIHLGTRTIHLGPRSNPSPRPFTQNHSPRPFTETLHRDPSPRPFTETFHQNHSPRPFTETIHTNHSPRPFTETFHPKPFTQNLSYSPLISQYPTHFPFSILSRILTQYPHYNPSLNLGSDPFIQTSG